MDLAALRAWAEPRGVTIKVERLDGGAGRVWLRIWAELDGRPVYVDRIVDEARADATLDLLAAGMLQTLRA